jgi:Raf kinase inhibitor-like YbhB/YbcL family protein
MRPKSFAQFTLIAVVAVLLIPCQLGGQENQSDKAGDQWHHRFVLTSTAFTNGGTLPLSMAYDQAGCAPNGEIGGNQSPQMSWTRPKPGTQSFVVILFDPVASFTHWGMYNISPDATGLPENAGVADSTYGEQINNDYDFGEQYDGPCPPTTLTPTTHEYVLTVYALDENLTLPKGSADFPPGSEILYHKLIEAARGGHILESASIHGFFSAVSTNSK